MKLVRTVWRYQIGEGQTIQWPSEKKRQNDKQPPSSITVKKFPVVTMTAFLTILGQNRYNSRQRSTLLKSIVYYRLRLWHWRRKIWFKPPFLWKCLYQVRAIAVFPVFRLLTDFVCLLTCEFCLSLWKIARCSVILLLPLFNSPFPKIGCHYDSIFNNTGTK
jgi:hypothetical protein